MGSFKLLLLQKYFSAFFLFSFWCSHYICWFAWCHLTFLWGSVYFLYLLFSLFFRLHNLYWSIFNFLSTLASSNLLLNPSCEFFLYWSIISLQCWVSFCCTMKWINYMYMYIPSFLDLPPTPLSHPPRLSQSTELSFQWL